MVLSLAMAVHRQGECWISRRYKRALTGTANGGRHKAMPCLAEEVLKAPVGQPSVQSRSLSNSGREETPGADQARRLTPLRPRRTGAAGRSAALAARERGPSAVDAGVASTRAARSNRLVRGLLLLRQK